jgi:hypothetical protein
MAKNVVFFADKKQAARAGQLRDKIPNAIWFYDIFTPDVIRETGMLQANGMYNRDMSQLAASMFARVTKGTAYLVIGKEDAPDSSLNPDRRTSHFWPLFQASLLTGPTSKFERIVRVNIEDFACRGVVWQAGWQKWDVVDGSFGSNIHAELASFEGYVGDIEWPLCSIHHCWECGECSRRKEYWGRRRLLQL